MLPLIRIVVASAFVAVMWSVPFFAQAPRDEPQERADGNQLFKTWCASCHGLTAQGNGPLAPMMKAPVPDLTLIAGKNGGVFPSARVARIIDGRDVVSHGDPEMPIWGTAFKSTRDGYSEASVRARIDAVVTFLESVQKRNAH
jgi:mono/diheme cytochrome c family protein